MDRRTLFWMQAGLLLFLGSVILTAFRQHREQRHAASARWFAVAFLMAGIGLGLQAERGNISPILSIVLGNGIFMLFGPFANRSIAITTGAQKDNFRLLLLLDAGTVANYAYFTFWQPNVLLRVQEAVFVMLIMYSSSIALLLQAKDPVIRPAARTMVLVFCAHIAFNVFRFVMATRARSADIWFSWMGIISIAGLALSFLWMDMLRLNARLQETAMTDPLTGLFNRRALEVIGLRELARSARRAQVCSALMIDVDHFKQINDRLGHAAGDMSLRAVADALREGIRTSDLATRLGGDEFFILMPDTDADGAVRLATRLREAIGELRLDAPQETFTIAVSVGVATLASSGATIESLLHESDVQLYREKAIRRAHQDFARPRMLVETASAQVVASKA